MNPSAPATAASRPTVPAAVWAERQLIGAALLRPAVYAETVGLVEHADFFHPVNAAIWRAIEGVVAASQPIEEQAIIAQMHRDGTAHRLIPVGDVIYFAEITSDIVTTHFSISFACAAIRGTASTRRLIEACHAALQRAHAPDGHPDEVREILETACLSASQAMADASAVPVKTAIREAVGAIETRYSERDGTQRGARSGWAEIDSHTGGGWIPGRLYVVAARPGMGKTALGMGTVIGGANRGAAAFVTSLEMDRASLAERLLSAEGGIDGDVIASGRLNGPEFMRLTRATSDTAPLPIWIDDQPTQTIAQIAGRVRRWRMRDATVEKFPAAVLVIDYLQIVAASGRADKREEQVAEIARGCKQIARSIPGLAVIALAQLNREVEKRPGRRPVMADLRESGAIEQEADVVAFLHRPVVYDQSAQPDAAEFIVAKNRFGRTGTVNLTWRGQFTQFVRDQ